MQPRKTDSAHDRARQGLDTTKQYHHQAIHRLADPLRVTLSAADGVIEGAELRAESAGLLPWFASVQFHPERLYVTHPEHARLFRAFVQACTQNH